MLNWVWRFSHSMAAIAVPHSDYRGWEILRSLVDHMQYISAEVIPTSCKLLALYHIIAYRVVEGSPRSSPRTSSFSTPEAP